MGEAHLSWKQEVDFVYQQYNENMLYFANYGKNWSVDCIFGTAISRLHIVLATQMLVAGGNIFTKHVRFEYLKKLEIYL